MPLTFTGGVLGMCLCGRLQQLLLLMLGSTGSTASWLLQLCQVPRVLCVQLVVVLRCSRWDCSCFAWLCGRVVIWTVCMCCVL